MVIGMIKYINKLKFYLRSKLICYKNIQSRNFVPNINFCFTRNQKHILLSYSSCIYNYNYPSRLMHSNSIEITEIINLLISYDFCIDIIDCDFKSCRTFLSNRHYDYILGFGYPYYEAHILNPHAKCILFLTENFPSYVKIKSDERYKYYYERNHKRGKGVVRDASLFKDEYLFFSDFLIKIGNKSTKLENCKQFCISPSGLRNPNYTINIKDYNTTKHKFVWFGSSGAIHKGLDLLIDVFKMDLSMELYIYGLNPKDEYLLNKITPNIHNCGKINVEDDEFIEQVVNRNSFVVLPSCSEAQSTGVITCMLHGLIPIVSEECQFPNFSFGIQLHGFSVEYLHNKLCEATNLDNQKLKSMSYASYFYANNNYSIFSYRERLKNVFAEILVNNYK